MSHTTSPNPTIHALLVGINAYKSDTVPDLHGCVNDIEAMEQLLTDRYGVPPGRIHRLINTEATHTAIKAAFEEHLIGAARAWDADGRKEPAPAFLFHYSGHGSQATDSTGTEPDGKDETIVPHDSRQGDVYDIKDWELGALVAQLSAISDNVTVVLDSCHSGSGTRAIDDTLDAVRECPPDDRPDQPRRPKASGTRDATGASGWIATGKHVLIAGCRDLEKSHEMLVPEGTAEAGAGAKSGPNDDSGNGAQADPPSGAQADAAIGAKGDPASVADGGARGGGIAAASPAESVRKQGALTYHLIEALAQMSPDRTLTYGELMDIVRPRVTQRYANQTPQCEGDRGREVFGGARPARDVLLKVEKLLDDGRVEIGGGVAHGLTVGTTLAAYPAGTRKVADAGAPLATLTVESTSATRSTCTVEPAGAVPEGAKAAITQLNYGKLRTRVALAIDDGELAERVRARLLDTQGDPDVTGLIELVEANQAADLRIAVATDKLVIQDPAGKTRVAPFGKTQLDDLASDLRHIARFRNGVAVRNPDPHSRLGGKITLEVFRLKVDADGAFVSDADGQLAIEPVLEENGILQLTAVIDRPPPEPLDYSKCDCLVFKITNNHTTAVQVALLNYAPSWATYLLHPYQKGSEEILQAGRAIYIGRSKDLVAPATLGKGMLEGQEVYKLIAIAMPDPDAPRTDFSVIEQPPLKGAFDTKSIGTKDGPRSPLQDLFDQAAVGGTRGSPLRPITSKDDWTTVELQALTVLAPEEGSRDLMPGATTALNYGVKVTAPAGFSGTVRLLTAAQSTRAMDGDAKALQPPPGLAGFGDWFQPLALGTAESRGTDIGALGAPGAVIEIGSEQPVWGTVTPETPMSVELPDAVAAGAGVLALGYDGSLYYPVGRLGADRRTVEVGWLPEPAPADEEPLHARRSLGKSLWLHLYTTLGWSTPQLGLRRSRFVPAGEAQAQALGPGEQEMDVPGGKLRYGPVRPGDLKADQTVALFVHGFISDTSWMAKDVVDWLASHGARYDHVLTFDYETMGTGIAENGATLAEKLRAAGFGPDDGVKLDVFAHSMGTQVTRSMIEQHGGHAFVDRAFLAGPPNAGTNLASLKDPVVWLMTLMLNQAGPTPPTMVASWALKKFADSLVGMQDLRPTSDFYKALNHSGRQHDVAYRVLIGRNTMRDDERTAWERAARRLDDGTDTVLDLIHADDNDLAISVSSARALETLPPPATDPERLDIFEVPCNHFGYFKTPEAQAQLLKWLDKA